MPLLKNNRRWFLSSIIKLVYIRGTRRHHLKMESYFRRWPRGTRYALELVIHINYLTSYVECCSSSRVFCSLLAKAVFHSTVFFFSFTVYCCFMAILKTPADTNAGQSRRLTYCIKSLHWYYLKSFIFKHSLLFIHTFKNTTHLLKTYCFVSQSLTNAISLPLVYSISSKHVFIAVSNFRERKKKLKPDTSGSIFPTTLRQKLNPQPREGLTNQIPHSPGTEHSQMPGVCP